MKMRKIGEGEYVYGEYIIRNIGYSKRTQRVCWQVDKGGEVVAEAKTMKGAVIMADMHTKESQTA